tara:strand:- start:1092 stop:2156 length:1065 start_codon:yes stop_codon:yes gene_type:complete
MSRPNLIKIAYLTLQQGRNIAGLAHKELSNKVMELVAPEAKPEIFPVDKDLLLEVRNSMSELEEIDWEEAEKGFYPKQQLFDLPWLNWIKNYPLIWLDMPSTWERRKKRNTRDIPKNINQESYPKYYLQNFHHQTDGYLSDHSAGLYDLQVDILFNGTADAMRRRIIAPLKNGLKLFNENSLNKLKVLDVATGTGRTLQQIRSSLQEVDLYGLDLSSSYLKKASHYLSNRKGELVELIKGNAENMPFSDKTFHGLTCVFLLHELPREARQNVLNECFRIIKPGGKLILADSIQISDSPKFITIMESFHKIFHEPFYYDYIKDDIDSRIKEAGFKEISAKSYFMTRVWSAQKPFT